MSITFEHPGWLLLLVLLVPVWLLAWSTRGAHGRVKTGFILGTRTILVLLLAVAMAEPVWEQEGEGVTVAVVLDRSRSMPESLQQRSVRFLQDAADGSGRQPEDRIAVVHVATPPHQHPRDRRKASPHCTKERSLSIFVRGVGVGTPVQQ